MLFEILITSENAFQVLPCLFICHSPLRQVIQCGIKETRNYKSNTVSFEQISEKVSWRKASVADLLYFDRKIVCEIDLKQIDECGDVHFSDCIKKKLISSEQLDEQGVTLYNLDAVIAVGYSTLPCSPVLLV